MYSSRPNCALKTVKFKIWNHNFFFKFIKYWSCSYYLYTRRYKPYLRLKIIKFIFRIIQAIAAVTNILNALNKFYNFMFYILYISMNSSVCYVFGTHWGVFRQFCYTQKMPSKCFVQSFAPCWWANKIWNMKQLVCFNNILNLIKLSACVGWNCNHWITMHEIENVKNFFLPLHLHLPLQ